MNTVWTRTGPRSQRLHCILDSKNDAGFTLCGYWVPDVEADEWGALIGLDYCKLCSRRHKAAVGALEGHGVAPVIPCREHYQIPGERCDTSRSFGGCNGCMGNGVRIDMNRIEWQ